MAVIIQYAFPRKPVLGRADLRADRSSSKECDCCGRLEGGPATGVGAQARYRTWGQSHYRCARISEPGTRWGHYHDSWRRDIRCGKCPSISQIGKVAPFAAVCAPDCGRGRAATPNERGNPKDGAGCVG